MSGAGGRAEDGICLGLDLGTSGLKAVALAASGEVVARASVGYPTSRPEPGAAEQDPGDWITAIERAAAEVATGAPAARWRAIGLSAMIPTLVTADPAGRPVGAAITWEDGRAEAQAGRLHEAYGREAGGPGGEALYEVTGQRVDGRYLLPMFLRLISDDPGRAARTAKLLGAKDYLFGWLTGNPATDPSTATGFGCLSLRTAEWDRGILAAAAAVAAAAAHDATAAAAHDATAAAARDSEAAALPALPPVLPATTTRPLRREAAAVLGCGQIPVCLGAADSVLGAFGLGARRPGQVAYVAGTSTVILGIAGKPMLDAKHRFLVTPLAEPGLWGLEMDLLATGSALRWMAELLGGGLDEGAVIALAAQVDPADAPVVLPYLSPGEQGALWDPALTGTITGLTLAHDQRHLARGLLNGIILESRRCLAVLDEAGDFDAELLAAGGGAAEPSFRADLADATGRNVVMASEDGTDQSARGAALLAFQAIGRPCPASESPAASAAHARRGGTGGPPADARKTPDPRRREPWNRLWNAHEVARLGAAAAGAGEREPARGGT